MSAIDVDGKEAVPTNKWKRSKEVVGILPTPQTGSNDSSAAPTGGASRFDSNTDKSDESEALNGKELAAAFQDSGVHPVFIFGSKGSGKTSLIASVFKYIQDREEADATIALAEDVYPRTDALWSTSISWSRDLFYKKVLDYIDNVAPQATQEDQPFFVPIRLTRSSGEEVLFAFLEGKGEWYQPDQSADVPFKKFKGLLHGMLQHYSAGSTFIYVAPYATDSGYEGPRTAHLRQSDLGLVGVLDECLSVRKPYSHQDRHMFMVSKWDICCESVVSQSFIDPTVEEIQTVLRERFPLSWKRYINSAMASDTQNRSFSAYCAGLIAGRDVVMPAEGDSENVAFYPRKLWDWLYENATGGSLYPDVRPKPPSIFDRILKWIRS